MADQPRYERLKAVKAAFEALTPEDVAALFKDGPDYEFMAPKFPGSRSNPYRWSNHGSP